MPQLVLTHPASPERLALLLTPRDDLVGERVTGPGRFELADGPFRTWERTVVSSPEIAPETPAETSPGPAASTEARADDTITETIRFRLAIPIWSLLFTPVVYGWLRKGPRRREPLTKMPWWAPPNRLDARTSTTLGLLASVGLVTGYLGTLLTQTNTYIRTDFDVSTDDVGFMLAAVRIGALLALAIVVVSDRRGRSRVLTITAVAACVLTATGALAPGLVWLGASQTIARALSTAMALILSVMAVEETPAGSRAYAVSLLTMTAGLGAGIAVMLLFVADLGAGAWRILYVVPLLTAVPLARMWHGLPETRRFAVAQKHRAGRRVGATPPRAHLRRLLLLAASGMFLALFVAPASGFQNDYLRTDHGYSAVQITLFTILTNTPAGIGIVVGGKLADTHGRRLVGAIGVAAGALFTLFMYLGSGWAIWGWSLGASVIGAIAIPALAVYGPELFPTEARGRANGIINLFAVVGSAAGLALAGKLADVFSGGLPAAMSVLVVGPAIVFGLILLFYPETASRELEELNPEDAPLAKTLLELEGLDL